MQPTFGLSREQTNELFYKTYKNVSGKFHFHSQLELFFVDEGEVDVFINDKNRRLKAGEMSVTLSYDAHTYRSAGDSVSNLLIIPVDYCEIFLEKIKNKKPADPFLCHGPTVKELRECYSRIVEAADNRLKTVGYIYVMFGIISEHMSFKDISRDIDTRLSSQILLYINDNFRGDVSLSSISARFGYTPGYISRYFKECFNVGINRYIRIIRLKNAVMLMHENKNSITYCALESGFNSMCTFYRSFYEEFGCNPRDYLFSEG